MGILFTARQCHLSEKFAKLYFYRLSMPSPRPTHCCNNNPPQSQKKGRRKRAQKQNIQNLEGATQWSSYFYIIYLSLCNFILFYSRFSFIYKKTLFHPKPHLGSCRLLLFFPLSQFPHVFGWSYL